MSLEEVAEIHAILDTDGDGEISLDEFEKAKAIQQQVKLPKPVRPVRGSIGASKGAQGNQSQAGYTHHE